MCVCVYSGVCWVDMHKLAERVELEELKKMGLLQGEVDQMMEVCTCVCVCTCVQGCVPTYGFMAPTCFV